MYSQVLAKRICRSGEFYREGGVKVVVCFDLIWVLCLCWLYTTKPAPNLLNSCLLYINMIFLKSDFLTAVAFHW